jgi:hypothetical protein
MENEKAKKVSSRKSSKKNQLKILVFTILSFLKVKQREFTLDLREKQTEK